MKNYERRILCKPRKSEFVIYFWVFEDEVLGLLLNLFVDPTACRIVAYVCSIIFQFELDLKIKNWICRDRTL